MKRVVRVVASALGTFVCGLCTILALAYESSPASIETSLAHYFGPILVEACSWLGACEPSSLSLRYPPYIAYCIAFALIMFVLAAFISLKMWTTTTGDKA